jgi:acyl carrier protein
LQQFLRERLPAHMVSSALVLLERLPRLPNGKLDRHALPVPQAFASQRSTGQTAPRNDTERLIASVWQEVLGLDRVGVTDNFFDLGGHSLLLVQVHARLRDVCTPEIPLVDLFRFPTVESLARRLNPSESEVIAAEAPGARARTRAGLESGRQQRRLARRQSRHTSQGESDDRVQSASI